MAKASELVKIAIAELGYCEKASNSQLDDKTANAGANNWTKYARDLHTAGYYQAAKNGYAWCDMFVDWCCLQLMGSKEQGEWLECQTGLYGAGCEWSSNCYRRAGRFGTEPKIGAQIFFGKTGAEEHTGIVEKFDATYVYTIEGNTSNKVARRTYARTSSRIVGYGYMRFDEENETQVSPEAPAEPQKPAEQAKPTETTPVKPTAQIKVGDLVRIVGTTYYGGNKNIPTWVKNQNWYVMSVSGDRVVINKNEKNTNEICSPVNIKDVETVNPVNTTPQATQLKVGDVVKIKKDCKVYGKTYKFQAWVYDTKLYVREIRENSVVISTLKTGAITGVVAKEDIIR